MTNFKKLTDLEREQNKKKSLSEYYQKNKDKIRIQRKEKYKNLPEEEKKYRRKIRNENSKRYYQKKKLLKKNNNN